MKLTNSDIKLLIAVGAQNGRWCDPMTIVRQIGRGTFMSVCGGRWTVISDLEHGEVGIVLLCGSNRAVEVVLDYNDTYSVRRRRMITSGVHKGDTEIEYSVSGIYCDDLGEIVHKAGHWK